MNQNNEEFSGCKLAYIYGNFLLVYKRDEYPDIPFAGLWDFPGGGREGEESSETCALRELKEEFAITLSETRLIYKKQFPSQSDKGNSYFFVALGTKEEVEAISFGDEGQYWKLVPIEEYLSHPKSIAALVSRLNGYFESKSS